MAINPHMYAKLPFQPQRDLQAVASVAQMPLIFVVQSSLPVRTMPEFIAWARSQGDKVHYSSAGHGSTGHLTGELFRMRTELKMTHIPYKGDVLRILNRAINEVLTQPETRAKLQSMGTEPTGGTPEQFAEILRRDDARWGSVVKANGLRSD